MVVTGGDKIDRFLSICQAANDPVAQEIQQLRREDEARATAVRAATEAEEARAAVIEHARAATIEQARIAEIRRWQHAATIEEQARAAEIHRRQEHAVARAPPPPAAPPRRRHANPLRRGANDMYHEAAYRVIERMRITIADGRILDNRAGYGARTARFHPNGVIATTQMNPLIRWFVRYQVYNLTNHIDNWPTGAERDLQDIMGRRYNNMFGRLTGWGFILLDSLRDFHSSRRQR
jgi:hypothetical protein